MSPLSVPTSPLSCVAGWVNAGGVSGFTSYNLLELTWQYEYSQPAVKEYVRAYYVDRGNERFAPVFCGSQSW